MEQNTTPGRESGEEQRTALEEQKKAEELAYTISGRVGKALEPVFRPLGFDWKISTALIGALAAKEVFVSQLGILYAVGDADETSTPLKEHLVRNYTPLQGFCIMLFCLLSIPCMATIAIVRRETNSWKMGSGTGRMPSALRLSDDLSGLSAGIGVSDRHGGCSHSQAGTGPETDFLPHCRDLARKIGKLRAPEPFRSPVGKRFGKTQIAALHRTPRKKIEHPHCAQTFHHAERGLVELPEKASSPPEAPRVSSGQREGASAAASRDPERGGPFSISSKSISSSPPSPGGTEDLPGADLHAAAETYPRQETFPRQSPQSPAELPETPGKGFMREGLPRLQTLHHGSDQGIRRRESSGVPPVVRHRSYAAARPAFRPVSAPPAIQTRRHVPFSSGRPQTECLPRNPAWNPIPAHRAAHRDSGVRALPQIIVFLRIASALQRSGR